MPTILDIIKEKHHDVPGIDKARNISEALAIANGTPEKSGEPITANTPRTFEVSFDIGKGTGTTPETMYVTEGESITLPSADGITPPEDSTGFGEWYSKRYKVDAKPGQKYTPIGNIVFKASYMYNAEIGGEVVGPHYP